MHFITLVTVEVPELQANPIEDTVVEEKLKYLNDLQKQNDKNTIRRNSWFYKEADEIYLRDEEDLLSLYEYSVGRGGNLLLNIAPDTEGLLPEKDSFNFISFGKKLKERFQNAIDCKITAEGDEFFIETDKENKVNCIVLEEDLTNGESVTQFEIMQATPTYVSIYTGKNIGHKRICTFPKTFGDRFKIKISGHNGDFKMKSIKLFNIV